MKLRDRYSLNQSTFTSSLATYARRGLHVEKAYAAFSRLSAIHECPVEKASLNPLSDLYNEFGGTQIASNLLHFTLVRSSVIFRRSV